MQSSLALSLRVCTASRSENGKVIGAAEGNKEMADRNNGFGAYDVPFLATRTGTKDRSEEEGNAEVRSVPDTSLFQCVERVQLLRISHCSSINKWQLAAIISIAAFERHIGCRYIQGVPKKLL